MEPPVTLDGEDIRYEKVYNLYSLYVTTKISIILVEISDKALLARLRF